LSILVRFTNTSPTTTEQYDKSVQRLQQVGDFPPDGMEYHVCFIADGNIRVSEIWESREQLNAFAERLMPVLAEMGVEPGEPERSSRFTTSSAARRRRLARDAPQVVSRAARDHGRL
jgi:hypothetical protein